jgi:hypothetical protein
MVVREGIPLSPRNEPVRLRFELLFGAAAYKDRGPVDVLQIDAHHRPAVHDGDRFDHETSQYSLVDAIRNGAVRQYFPKGTDLSVCSQANLNRTVLQPNQRPRKTLGLLNPELLGDGVQLARVWRK